MNKPEKSPSTRRREYELYWLLRHGLPGSPLFLERRGVSLNDFKPNFRLV